MLSFLGISVDLECILSFKNIIFAVLQGSYETYFILVKHIVVGRIIVQKLILHVLDTIILIGYFYNLNKFLFLLFFTYYEVRKTNSKVIFIGNHSCTLHDHALLTNTCTCQLELSKFYIGWHRVEIQQAPFLHFILHFHSLP